MFWTSSEVNGTEFDFFRWPDTFLGRGMKADGISCLLRLGFAKLLRTPPFRMFSTCHSGRRFV